MSEECDHVIGTVEQRDDYHFDTMEVRKSAADAHEKCHDTPHFTAHNFCHECGADVRSISKEVERRFKE